MEFIYNNIPLVAALVFWAVVLLINWPTWLTQPFTSKGRNGFLNRDNDNYDADEGSNDMSTNLDVDLDLSNIH